MLTESTEQWVKIPGWEKNSLSPGFLIQDCCRGEQKRNWKGNGAADSSITSTQWGSPEFIHQLRPVMVSGRGKAASKGLGRWMFSGGIMKREMKEVTEKVLSKQRMGHLYSALFKTQNLTWLIPAAFGNHGRTRMSGNLWRELKWTALRHGEVSSFSLDA